MMHKGRLEAFSDGVIAIIITIMVLELKPPHADSLEGLRPLLPSLLSYVLSFIYVGIYWNNHHHLFQAAKHVSGMTLWANLHLLFWLSLIPFVTNWLGDSGFATRPAAAYGSVLLMSGIAWFLLARTLLRHHPQDSAIVAALGRERKEQVSVALYILGIAIAVIGTRLPQTVPSHWAGIAAVVFYAIVAAIWFIPDKRIEHALANERA